MLKGRLKTIRVFLSLLFFLVLAILFLDFTGKVYHEATQVLLRFQFVPSLVRFLATFLPVAAGFIIILFLTLLFGRIYCSTLCPIGTLQDVFIALSRRLSPKKIIFRHKKPMNILRYSVLAVVILSILSGSILLINLFDPYSAFGKIFHNLFRPLVVLANNTASQMLALADIYWLPRIKWVPVSKAAVIFALAWGLVVLLLSIKRGRLYCNTICPVGSLLGLFAKYSLFRIRIDKSSCNSCGKCSVVCKAECVDPMEQKIDFTRCIGCMNCLYPCPDGGVKYQPFWVKNELGPEPFDIGKRKFIRNSSLLVASSVSMPDSLIVTDEIKGTIKGTVPIFREHPVTPPGASSQARFNSLCTACHLCVTACPTQVLQPAFLMYGLKGFLQPRMDYITSFCNFECTVCGEVCPTGAILPFTTEEKKTIQLGKSYFVKENCVVYTANTICGACSEHCPTKAVYMVPYQDKLNIPEVNNRICVGCGACEYACPTDPKSIYVEGNPLHLEAEKPVETKMDEEIDYKEEFPF